MNNSMKRLVWLAVLVMLVFIALAVSFRGTVTGTQSTQEMKTARVEEEERTEAPADAEEAARSENSGNTIETGTEEQAEIAGEPAEPEAAGEPEEPDNQNEPGEEEFGENQESDESSEAGEDDILIDGEGNIIDESTESGVGEL